VIQWRWLRWDGYVARILRANTSNFNRKTEGVRSLGSLRRGWDDKLKWISKKKNVNFWCVFTWLRIYYSNRLMWKCQESFGFCMRRGTYQQYAIYYLFKRDYSHELTRDLICSPKFQKLGSPFCSPFDCEMSMLYARNTLLPVMKMGAIARCSKKVSKPNAPFFSLFGRIVSYLDKWRVNCTD